jgi:hypothetical protein
MVELLGELIGLSKEDANRRSTPIEYEFEEPVLEVLVDRYQIQQIIINLITNAIDAMQDIDRQPLLRIRIGTTEGGRVLTEFIDNGHGLPGDGADRYSAHSYRPKRTGRALDSPSHSPWSKPTTENSGLQIISDSEPLLVYCSKGLRRSGIDSWSLSDLFDTR